MSELKTLCTNHGITIEARKVRGPIAAQSREWRDTSTHWLLDLARDGKQLLGVDFYTGSGCKGEPTAAGVLSGLLFDASALDSTFKEWASDLGENEDSLKALQTYLACQDMGRRVQTFLGALFEEFRNAQH